MNYVAEIENGTVIRVTCCPLDCPLAGNQIIIGGENTVGIGWTYENGAFVPPAYVEEVSKEPTLQ